MNIQSGESDDGKKDRGGFEGGARGPRPPPFRQVGLITQKKAKFGCSQTVKSNILLSQNAGNTIS